MILNMVGGGGGAGLNFSVKAYASVSVLPSVERENTIAVITDTEITSWIFSATQPATLSEGMVWISTGTVSSVKFNVLKKNGIEVYPIYAKQYISGAWVTKTAKIYHNSKWVELWSNQLYSPGNEWKAITGGWTGTAKKSNSSSSLSAKVPKITQNTNNMVIDGDSGGGIVHTAKKINLKNYNKITFKGSFTRGGSVTFNLLFACWENFGTYYSDGYVAATGMSNTSATEITVDISNVNTECYVGIGISSPSTATITSILLS